MKKVNYLFVLLCILTSTLFVSAQDSNQVDIIQDSKVKKLLEKHIEINAVSKMSGYRVKIHFGSDKSEAYEIKKLFLEKFPDVPAYAKYDQPNFNVRVGDFRTKLEAYDFLKKVQLEFPSAFIVKDEIEYPSIEPEPLTEKKSQK